MCYVEGCSYQGYYGECILPSELDKPGDGACIVQFKKNEWLTIIRTGQVKVYLDLYEYEERAKSKVEEFMNQPNHSDKGIYFG